ncbi:MAG TPA: hypothetical protein VJ839_05305 [Candidatus Limnocylindria bacterium]|nr:hypothetical protein [Candidatus Limnocylindria bacterium]
MRERWLEWVSLVGVAAILIGIWMLDGTQLGSSWPGALEGVVSQLPVTLPASLAVLVATAVQLAAGAVVVRALRGSPYRSVIDAFLGGIVGAVVIGLGCLMLLGGLGWFTPPALVAVNGGVIGLGWFVRPWFAEPPSLRASRLTVAGALVVLAWSGAVILQLASPVVPFIDVLPNHVAPAQHLATFGAFDVLTTAPSPIYGPSRMFLGYTGLLGSATVLSGQAAGLAVSAFILPATVLLAAGLARLASTVNGVGAGWWMLVAFTLTESFARMADARATVIVLALTTFCLVELLEGDERARPLTLAVALGATLFFHPLVGVMTAAVVAALVALYPDRYARFGVPALIGGGILALPQAATMIGVDLPSALGLIVVPPALGAVWLMGRWEAGRRWLAFGIRWVAVAAVVLVLVAALPRAEQWLSTFSGFFLDYPVLVLTVVVAGAVAGRRTFAAVPMLAFGIGLLAVLAAAAIPWQALGIEGIDFEVAKTLHYWVPVFLAVMAAYALRAVWLRSDLVEWTRVVAVGLFLLVAALPLRAAPIDVFHLGEHRMSETLSIDLRFAQTGFWLGYPDSRTVINAEQQELIDRLRDEVAAGLLVSTTPLLHVAFNFQQWDATPVGVFGGMIETMVSVETEVSSHTAGGRLHPFSDLETMLAEGFPYVLLEPEGVPADTRDLVLAAGYERIFANGQGEIFVQSGEVAADRR